MWQHFYELKTKPCKGFKSTKWRSHFVLWYYLGERSKRKTFDFSLIFRLVYLDNTSSLTGATPEEIKPITLAAAVEISITRPWAYGPRSLMRTTTD